MKHTQGTAILTLADQKTVHVRAMFVGALCVHRFINSESRETTRHHIDPWCITHRQTGLSALKDIRTRADALHVAELFQATATLRNAWKDPQRPANNKTLGLRFRELRDAVKFGTVAKVADATGTAVAV